MVRAGDGSVTGVPLAAALAAFGYPVDIHVEGGRNLRTEYPVGTPFRVLAKPTDREGGGEYLYSSYRWAYKVLWRPDQSAKRANHAFARSEFAAQYPLPLPPTE
jgi:hypothetical protein